MRCSRIQRSSTIGPPWRGAGSLRTCGGSPVTRGGVRTESTRVNSSLRASMAEQSLAQRLLAGDKRALARGITLVESDDPAGWELVREVYPKTGRAAVVGLTGAPGAGKSTLIAALTKLRRAAERQVAVLSIDPSSPFTHGALLGDRIRLSEHFLDPGVFIRSMASRGALGGLSEAALQAALLMDAAGKDHVFPETVGVGQAEAARGEGVETLVERMEEHRAFIEAEGTLSERRRRNLRNEVLALCTFRMRRHLEARLGEDAEFTSLLDEVVARRLDPASAATTILERFETGEAA